MDIYKSFGGLKLVDKKPTGMKLKAGDIFGEIGVLYNCARTATVKSISEMVLWTIKAHRMLQFLIS